MESTTNEVRPVVVIEATICHLEASHCRRGVLAERLEVPGVALVESRCGEYRNEATYVLHITDPVAYTAAVAGLTTVGEPDRVAAVVGDHLRQAARASGATGALAFDMRERVAA